LRTLNTIMAALTRVCAAAVALDGVSGTAGRSKKKRRRNRNGAYTAHAWLASPPLLHAICRCVALRACGSGAVVRDALQYLLLATSTEFACCVKAPRTAAAAASAASAAPRTAAKAKGSAMVRALIATSGVIWSCAEILLKPRALRASVVVDTTTFDDGGISGSSSAGAAQGDAGRRSGGPSGNNRSRLVPPPLPTAGVTSPLSSKTLSSAPSTSASSSPAQLRSAAEEKLRSTDLVCITISQRAIALLFELCNGGAADERLDVNSTDAPAATSSDQVRATVQRGVEALRLRRRRPRGASASAMISSEFQTTETALNRYWDSGACYFYFYKLCMTKFFTNFMCNYSFIIWTQSHRALWQRFFLVEWAYSSLLRHARSCQERPQGHRSAA
tara:strand:+ start:567 stop:1733 length:1167 start_codon:yes stop_codon:yes gene_type:complete